MTYYEEKEKLDYLKQLEKPEQKDFEAAKQVFADDQELTCSFYDKLNPGWLELLDSAGEFDGLGNKEAGILERYKAAYLVDCAEEKPAAVLRIIEKIHAKDLWIQSKFIEALLKMPVSEAVQGIETVFEYLEGEGQKVWHFGGEEAAKLMVKLKDEQVEAAFKLASVLVDARVTTDGFRLRDMVAKFVDRDYEELITKYYSNFFDVDASRATGILVKILSRYVEQASEQRKYDVSSLFYIRMENLEEIDCRRGGVLASLVKGICQGGRAVIEKQPGKVKELLDRLESLDKAIFYRIEMYLLRFVPKGVEGERINRLTARRKFLDEPGYEYEYRLLLRDKYDEVPNARKTFEKWVRERKVEDIEDWKKWFREVKEREPNDDDLFKYVAGMKARELYLVKERYSAEYEKYKRQSGLSDEQLAPRKMVGEARAVSPKEGTPLTSEEMAKMSPEEVLDYVSNPKNYEDGKKRDAWQSAKEGLASTLKEDVKKRTREYLGCDTDKLLSIPETFLSSLLYGIGDAVRDGSFGKENWAGFLEASLALAERNGGEEQYRNCFHAIVGTLRDAFSERKNSIELDEEMARQFWEILKSLVHFPVGDMSRFGEEEYERDPMQINCNLVAGEVLGLTVSLGIACKKRFGEYWEGELKAEMRQCWEFALSEIKQYGVNCMLGANFSRIHWLDDEWFEKNLDNMLSNELWDEIWGTYVSWGRPSTSGFNLLIRKGKYERAVEMLGTKNKFKYGKDPEEGLIEHLMIGYFNGWINLDSQVLVKFFENASAELRAKAAEFLTTGFEEINKEGEAEEKEKVAERMRAYWTSRIVTIKEHPKENKDEAIELTGWVENTVLPAKETLELLEQSLELSGGKIGRMRDARDFIEGVREIAEGNELLALRCLKMAAADENMHMPWSMIQDPLVDFLEKMAGRGREIRSAAREVADAYGRYSPDKFRGVWEKLNKDITPDCAGD